MAESHVDESAVAEIDDALRHWRQGDCVLGEHWFTFRVNPERLITLDSIEAQEESEEIGDLVDVEVDGLVVLTQTCDIVRSCAVRPFVEVTPLVEVDENAAREIERGRRPQYATIPGVADKGLVADLDRTMTVEKSVVAKWERIVGCHDAHQTRRLSLDLARKRARFAFPDDFVHFSRKLQARLQKKHDKQSDEGEALRALREIRVRAAPSWRSDKVEVSLWFIRDNDMLDFGGKGWDEWLEGWLGLFPESERFVVDGLVTTLDDMTARDYVESDPLDLDHLSSRERG